MKPVARLIVRDAELQVEQAEATLEIANGEVQRALAEKTAATARLHNPTHRRAELADAKSLLARANSELARLPSLLQAAEAREKFARLSQKESRRQETLLPQSSSNSHAVIRDGRCRGVRPGESPSTSAGLKLRHCNLGLTPLKNSCNF